MLNKIEILTMCILKSPSEILQGIWLRSALFVFGQNRKLGVGAVTKSLIESREVKTHLPTKPKTDTKPPVCQGLP